MNRLNNPNNYTYLKTDSEMIQAAVDEAAKNGEKVVIPKYNERTKENVWIIDKSIKLHSGSVIYLDNCTLLHAEGVYENIFTNSNLANGQWKNKDGKQKSIYIYGIGEAILGNTKHNDLRESTSLKDGMPHIYRNSTILFVNVEDIIVDNIKIVNQRYWAINFNYCTHGRISNIKFYATADVPNQDGIDIRTGCSEFIIENITGVTGDDTIALTNLTSIYDEEMEKLGRDNSIHNVIVRNVSAHTKYSLVRLLNHCGKKLYNVTVENIFDTYENPEFEACDEKTAKLRPGTCVRIGENFYNKDKPMATMEETYNITVRNIGTHARMAVKASCALSSAVIENIKLYADGGTAVLFDGGKMKNIIVRDVFYSLTHSPSPTDDNRLEKTFNNVGNPPVKEDRELCAFYFRDVNINNLIIQNVFASDKLSAVFGGTGTVNMKKENIFKESEPLKMFLNDDILNSEKL